MDEYENKVIEAARQGYNDAFIKMDSQMELLLRYVYRAGVKQGRIVELEKQIKSVGQ